MTHPIKISLIALILLLGACARGEQARPAELLAPAQGTSDFGELRVHYNALPTLSLSNAMAREYKVAKDPSTALVFVALRQVAAGDERNAVGSVTAQAYDLQGARQDVAFAPVSVGEYTDHIGVIRTTARDTYRIALEVTVDGRTQALEFQRNF